MDLPTNLNLPFFAHGIFMPGELGFLQLKDLVVERPEPRVIPGILLIRDGLPLIDPEGQGEIRGALLRFHTGSAETAYQRVADMEPDHQYRWAVVEAEFGRANYLAGRSPSKGSVMYDEGQAWSGHDDPLFKVALDIIDETLRENFDFNWNLKPLFRLEMAYLLLWSAIERYASLRYRLGGKPTQKVLRLADDTNFQQALQQSVTRVDEVFRADRPNEKYVLDPKIPKDSLLYYYQIRNNAVHRGKAVTHDHDRLRAATTELLNIFRVTLKGAFRDAAWPT